MSVVYQYFGVSRQAAAQARARAEAEETLQAHLILLVKQIRSNHPRMGLRKIYHMLIPLPIGRDRFEHLMCEQQLQVKRKAPAWKTTLSQSLVRFPNLLSGSTLNGIHQAWVCDITYFWLPSRFAYIMLIEDVYTRLIIAALASETLRAEANIAVLAMALDATRAERDGTRTIHHSDYGVQYTAREYLALAGAAHMRLSMCAFAYENAYIERAIGTVKNEYLLHRNITTFSQLKEELARTVQLYNTERPHQTHPGWMPPSAFAAHVRQLNIEDRPILQVYDSNDDRAPRKSAVPGGRCQEYTKPV